MKPDWILVANAAHARLLQQEPAGRMTLLQSLEHPTSRMRSSQLGDDKAGREFADRSFGGAAFSARTDAQRKERQRFARQLAELLEEGVRSQRFEAVHLFASSPFLGELKRALEPGTRRLLAGTHDVDLSAVGWAELPSRIARETTMS
ncbi:host attachment protein [Ramlibacter sp.]|uniref:host attachment protein n=1 Tax=Ramlibacter sp. TaxID=1917967 RepID=UPI002FC5C217